MTDPVAEAAAKIAADAAPSSTEPTGIIGDIVNEFHKLEEKVEHLIHPEAVSVGIENKASLASAPIAEGGALIMAETEAPTVEAPGEALPSGTPADSGTSPGSSGPASTASEAGNVAAAAGAGEPVAGAVAAAGGDIPNAAPAAVVQPVIAASAPAASTPAGIPGIVASSVAEPVSVKPTSLASGNIRSSIAAIKHHLSIRGFEQSAVADIHAELDAIEKWL